MLLRITLIKAFELEHTLVEKSKNKLLEEVRKISNLASFAYVRQPVQKGDGHALLCASQFVDPNENVLMVFSGLYNASRKQNFQKK